METKESNRTNEIPWKIKLILIVIALCIAYLFALNGRYSKFDEEYFFMFDSWTNSMYQLNGDEWVLIAK